MAEETAVVGGGIAIANASIEDGKGCEALGLARAAGLAWVAGDIDAGICGMDGTAGSACDLAARSGGGNCA